MLKILAACLTGREIIGLQAVKTIFRAAPREINERRRTERVR
jgi:hypothetical protein